MATIVRIPKLGQEMTEGTVIEWLKRVGETVAKGEPIFELMTDKANVDVESPREGVVASILIEEDQPYPVGTPALIIASDGEELSHEDVEELLRDSEG